MTPHDTQGLTQRQCQPKRRCQQRRKSFAAQAAHGQELDRKAVGWYDTGFETALSA
jgi:hypothetical protein